MKLTDAHVNTFLEEGLVLIDDVFTIDEMTAASAAFDRQYETAGQANGIRGMPDDLGLIDVLQHPHLEAIAKHMLGADDVVLNSSAMLLRHPNDATTVTIEREHVDIQFSLEEMKRTPRCMLAMLMVFIEDLPEGRGNTWIRPRSHRQISQWLADHNAEPVKAQPTPFDDLPAELNFAPLQPVVAKRTQAAAFTTAVVHSGSTNIDTKPRKIMFVNFSPKGMLNETSGNHNQREGRNAWRSMLAEHLRPERRHLALDSED